MPEELNEDEKLAVAKKYDELRKTQLISDAANDLGISETSFHKYKNYKGVVQKEDETTDKDDDSFEDKFVPDKDNEETGESRNEDDDEDDEDDEEEEEKETVLNFE